MQTDLASQFKFKKFVGKGAFSEVYLAQHVETKSKVAMCVYASQKEGGLGGLGQACRPNLGGLVLGCIQADLLDLVNTHVKALAGIYTIHIFVQMSEDLKFSVKIFKKRFKTFKLFT